MEFKQGQIILLYYTNIGFQKKWYCYIKTKIF